MRASPPSNELNAQLEKQGHRVGLCCRIELYPTRDDKAVSTAQHDEAAGNRGRHYSIGRSARSFVQLQDTGCAC